MAEQCYWCFNKERIEEGKYPIKMKNLNLSYDDCEFCGKKNVLCVISYKNNNKGCLWSLLFPYGNRW